MKFIQILNSILFFLILIIFVKDNSVLGSEANLYEKKLKDITLKLRCMTCQNQTIYESDADFSEYIKKIILDKLKKNQSEERIINFLIERYGEYIVFEPQMNIRNMFLWFFPFVIMALSLVFLIIRMNKK